MKIKFYLLFMPLLMYATLSIGQDTSTYKLRISIPIGDFPQNISLPYNFPSMNQALELSDDFYELSFLGIDVLGDKIFISKTKPYTKMRRFSNNAFKYVLSLAFSKYGSELPIPLGVWGHEEFHRSVLGVNSISAENGNWLFSRWDGTVYGVTDLSMENLKADNTEQLLYSYISGVQYEILLNERNTLDDFYKYRSMPDAALKLYNAWYVFDYFRFSTSPMSDSVKILAPPHESSDPAERDFAGADLTAWVYDMFNPDVPYSVRDNFPGGEGVNRRVGFSDLSEEAKDYLVRQKKLSLLNFLNPSIFFINRIRINENLEFNFFTQYSPTHFGNDIAAFLPVKYRKYDLLISGHRYESNSGNGFGIGAGFYNFGISKRLESDFTINIWDQPETFFGTDKVFGGSLWIKAKYLFGNNLSGFISASGKSKGWILGNPYLNSNVSFQVGVAYNLVKK